MERRKCKNNTKYEKDEEDEKEEDGEIRIRT